jgi:DUF971 family protein
LLGYGFVTDAASASKSIMMAILRLPPWLMHQPTEITVHQRSRLLEVAFEDGQIFKLPFEFLRVYSPSAEVRGHGPGQEELQVGKRDVEISKVEPVGQYAIQIHFSDGHSTGLYSWEYIYEIGTKQGDMWQYYLDRMQAAGASRDTSVPGVK